MTKHAVNIFNGLLPIKITFTVGSSRKVDNLRKICRNAYYLPRLFRYNLYGTMSYDGFAPTATVDLTLGVMILFRLITIILQVWTKSDFGIRVKQ